jgi:hypothetical protein
MRLPVGLDAKPRSRGRKRLGYGLLRWHTGNRHSLSDDSRSIQKNSFFEMPGRLSRGVTGCCECQGQSKYEYSTHQSLLQRRHYEEEPGRGLRFDGDKCRDNSDPDPGYEWQQPAKRLHFTSQCSHGTRQHTDILTERAERR